MAKGDYYFGASDTLGNLIPVFRNVVSDAFGVVSRIERLKVSPSLSERLFGNCMEAFCQVEQRHGR